MNGDKRAGMHSVDIKSASPLEYRKKRLGRKVTLPDTFPEKVLEIESWIDKGEFVKEDLDELMLIYSQVVEYYNSINSEKASYYADRIQVTLIEGVLY